MKPNSIISLWCGKSSKPAKFLRYSKCGKYIIVQIKANKTKEWERPIKTLPSLARKT